MSDKGYRLGTPDDDIPKEDKIHIVTVDEMLEKYQDIMDLFLERAVMDYFPDDVSITWRWEDKKLHLIYLDRCEHRVW